MTINAKDLFARQEKLQKSHDRIRNAIMVVFGVMLTLIAASWVTMGVALFQSFGFIQENGVRGLVEKLWCGRDVMCSLSNTEDTE